MKPTLPKGTRDFSPEQVAKRNYIFDTMRQVFVKYGYQPIETPVMESLSTLTGKYGEEGDRLLFKILNSGDFLAKADKNVLESKHSTRLIPSIAEKGLRYDLTVPFARYVVMHQNDITYPFKRYQIQPVWRADKPQRGRYREFYQCDVDIVGADSLMYEAEFIQIYDEVFAKLNIKVDIKVNNRKILAGIAEVAGISEQFTDMTVMIDKLDKIGLDGVKKGMEKKEIGEEAINKIVGFLNIKTLADCKKMLAGSEIGLKGIEELETLHSYLDLGTLQNEARLDITLARGLNYYTGCIFEVSAKEAQMGSIGGGGRYADLTSVFGLKNVSGVGVSFGAERIYDIMEEQNLFPKENKNALTVLLVAFDDKTHHYAFQQLIRLRQAGINADLYPKPTKLAKQMKYANTRKIPFTIIIGDQEMENNILAIKNMQTGEQEQLSIENIIKKLEENL